MCGIFGVALVPNASKDTIRMAIAKLKVLGLYNMTRGRHSCGLFIDNDLMKGVDKEKEFSDFIVGNELPVDLGENKVIIGHTRHATHGAHTEINAHPHMVGDDFVLAHNGVIRNIWPLCTKYGINHNGIQSDSLGLAHIISNEGFGVLNEYEGNAALAMSWRSEPNTLYIYKGESKFTRHEDAKEERPLYYMEAEEGIYISSMENALFAISDETEERIYNLKGNTVFRIVDGKFTDFEFKVERGENNLGKSFDNRGNGHSHHTNTSTATKNVLLGTNGAVGCTTNSSIGNCFTKKHVPMIWYETLPARANRAKDLPIMFYHMGRYWVMNPKEETGEITLAHGAYYINSKGVITDKREQFSQGAVDIKNLYNHYFYEGVMMKGEKSYEECEKDPEIGVPNQNFAYFISKYSMYPVCNSKSDVAGRCKQTSEFYLHKWYHGTEMTKNMSFTPRWCDRNYVIKAGLLEAILVQKGTTAEVCLDHESYQKEVDKTEPYVQLPKETNKETPVVSMHPMLHKTLQHTIPFEKGIVKGMEDWDVQNFYTVWDNLLQVRNKLSPLEMNAIRFYVCDVMSGEMNQIPDSIYDDSVEVQMNMFLTMCIETGKSIYEMWDDTAYPDILSYLVIAQEDTDGEYVKKSDRESEGVTEECCGIESVVKNFVDRRRSGEEIFHEEVIDQTTKNVDDEGPFIDEIVNREQARVPDTSKIEIEEIAPAEEISYEYKDAIDYLGDVRKAGVELTKWEDNEFCQEVAAVIFSSVDALMHRMREIAHNHGEIELSEYADDEIKDKIQL